MIYLGNACDTPYDVCTSNPCNHICLKKYAFDDFLLGLNGGICLNLGSGLYTCTCPAAFTGNSNLFLK